MKKAQTSTEYLVILGVVLVIGVIVVGVLSSSGGVGAGLDQDSQVLSAGVEEVGIQSFSSTFAGSYMELRNNHQDTITIINMTIDNQPVNIVGDVLPIVLRKGQSKLIKTHLVSQDGSASVQINYTKVTGGEYSQELVLSYDQPATKFGDDLRLYFSFDYTTSSTVFDLAGYDSNGTLTGDLVGQHTTGLGYYTFDGSDEITFLAGAYSPTGEYTWAAWIYQSSFSSVGTIFGGWDTAGEDPDGYYIHTNATGHVRVGGANVYSSGNMSAGEWNHIVVTMDGSSWNFYINGASAGSDTGSFDLGSLFRVGQTGDDFGYYTGRIDELQAWDRVLSASEISELYAFGR